MGKNYDMIATVSIDIASPIVDGTSFDNILIVGPLPKETPEKMPPKVGAYSSIEEVTDTGWSIIGDAADPVGLAAQVAFSQSPRPTTVYIAPMQLTAAAVTAGQVIDDTNTVLAEKVGTKENLTGCTVAFDKKKRLLQLNLISAASKVKNTGLFDALGALIEQGYRMSIDGTPLTDVDAFKAMPVFEQIIDMKKGSAPIQFIVDVAKEDVSVAYGAVIRYPDPLADTAEEYNEIVLDNPQNEAESAVETVQRALATAGWYVVCPAGIDPAEYESLAAFVETQTKMFCYTENAFFGAGEDGENESYVGDVYFRSIGIFGKEETDQLIEDMPTANHYMNVAFAVKWLYYSAGSETAAFKVLSGVYPSELSTTEMKALQESSMNFFITVGNKNLTMNGMTRGGEWCDVIRFRDWLQNDMQLRVVNLFVMNPKIPYTDNGISLVQNQMIASLKAGQAAGGIAEDEFDEDGTRIPGFTTSVPLAASLTASEKASRKLKKCKFKARLAGAIHFAEINGSLTYEL